VKAIILSTFAIYKFNLIYLFVDKGVTTTPLQLGGTSLGGTQLGATALGGTQFGATALGGPSLGNSGFKLGTLGTTAAPVASTSFGLPSFGLGNISSYYNM